MVPENGTSERGILMAEANSCLIFLTRIQKVYPELSNAEKRIADYMLQNTKEVLDLSAESLGAQTKTSAATIIRFCKACGFSGLTDLKLTLKQEYNIVNNLTHESRIEATDPVSTIKRKVMGYHSLVINSMLSEWNESAYTMAAEAIIQAKRILIIGEGGSHSTASCLLYVLSQLGLSCDMSMDSVFEVLKISNMGPEDLVIGVTYTGRLRNTVESFRYAKERGIPTIGLVGNMNSPVLDYVDILLNTNMAQTEFYSSMLSVRVSETAVVEVIYAMVAAQLGHQSDCDIPLLNAVEEVRRAPKRQDG